MESTRKHLRFQHQRKDYAERFGVSIETIDAWIRRGKCAGKKVPLDAIEQMPQWWSDCMSGPLPACFNGHGSNGNAQPRDFSDVKGLSIEANVEALRVTLAINKKLLDEALAGGHEVIVVQRQRNYERCFNLLRLAEQTLLDLQKERGQLIDKEKFFSDQIKIVEALKQMRAHMARSGFYISMMSQPKPQSSKGGSDDFA
jgi:hypothetical protein